MIDRCKSCWERCCCQTEEDPNDEVFYASAVDEVDTIQMAEFQRILDSLRRGMNPIVEQPPPAYEDFAKYPLAKQPTPYPKLYEYIANNRLQLPVMASETPLQRQPEPNSHHEPDSNISTWKEPYPKPTGDPPPVPQNWFSLQIDNWRRSIRHLFYRDTNQPPSRPTQSLSVIQQPPENSNQLVVESTAESVTTQVDSNYDGAPGNSNLEINGRDKRNNSSSSRTSEAISDVVSEELFDTPTLSTSHH